LHTTLSPDVGVKEYYYYYYYYYWRRVKAVE
jgi:hypothetical protein